MSRSAIHEQLEQARSYLAALMNQVSSLKPGEAEQISASLQQITPQLAALVSGGSPPAGAPLPSEPLPSEPLPSGPLPSGPLPSGRFLETILDQINSVAVVYDENGVVQVANRYAKFMLGFDPSQMQREALFGRLAVRDEQGSPVYPDQMPASRASRGEIVENMRLEITNAQGRTFSVLASAKQLAGANGQMGVVSIWNDFTEYEHAKQAVEKANTDVINEKNRLLAVMEALPTGVAIYDTQGGITHANRSFEEVWGSPRPQVNSVEDYAAYKAWWVENGQRVQPGEWASAQAVRHGHTVLNQFLELQRFDGTRAFVLNSGAPVFDAEGNIVGSAVAIRDVTQRVEVEQALRVSEERFRVALSSLPMTVYTLDQDLRFTWIHNPQGGVTMEQVLGKRTEEIFPAISPEFLAAQQSVIETGQGVHREFNIQLTAEVRSFLVSIEPLRDANQHVSGLTAAILDMTERRRIETEHNEVKLQMELQRLLLEHREKERQEIAREIHDGPIQSIVGQMFRMHSSKEGVLDPKAIAALDETAAGLRSIVQELRELVNEMRPPVLIRFGLTRAIQIHSEDFRAKYQNVRLDLDLVEDANLLSEDTCLALYRIYQESLNNVMRHAQASAISVRYYPSNGDMVLEIKDDGRGFHLPKDWVGLTRGNHFGLAGIRERTEAIGGKLHIISSPGAGSQVCVHVPIQHPTS